MVGPEVERTALVRHCTRLFNVGANMTAPLFSVVVRKAYGLGAQAMCGAGTLVGFFAVAWPTAEFAGMNIEGAVKLGYRKELMAIEDPEARRLEFERRTGIAYDERKGGQCGGGRRDRRCDRSGGYARLDRQQPAAAAAGAGANARRNIRISIRGDRTPARGDRVVCPARGETASCWVQAIGWAEWSAARVWMASSPTLHARKAGFCRPVGNPWGPPWRDQQREAPEVACTEIRQSPPIFCHVAANFVLS